MPNAIGESQQYAFAKLTTRLAITGVRDDGYHLIDAEMVSLDFYDRLTFTDGDGIELAGLANPSVPTGADNIVAKALRLAGKTAHVVIDKQIPAGGGLGGGSADAAAALRWVGVTNAQVAVRIGADVPFCIAGGRARVTGIGEELQPLSFEERVFTLLIPPLHVSTKQVFAAFDEMSVSDQNANAINQLERAAVLVEPRLIEWFNKFGEWTNETPVLAGSGSTWFVEGAFEVPKKEALNGARWIVSKTTPPLPLA